MCVWKGRVMQVSRGGGGCIPKDVVQSRKNSYRWDLSKEEWDKCFCCKNWGFQNCKYIGSSVKKKKDPETTDSYRIPTTWELLVWDFNVDYITLLKKWRHLLLFFLSNILLRHPLFLFFDKKIVGKRTSISRRETAREKHLWIMEHFKSIWF